MNYNGKAIDFEAQVARNREIIKGLDKPKGLGKVFAPFKEDDGRQSRFYNLRQLYTEYFGDA